MKPVTATVTVPKPRDEEFDLPDMLGNHERFSDRFPVKWEFTTHPSPGDPARSAAAARAPGDSARSRCGGSRTQLNYRSKEEAR